MNESVSLDEILRVAPFRFLKPETAREALALGRERRFEAGSPVFRQGEPGDSFGVILAGEVSVHLDGAGAGCEVARLGPGECVGEMAVLSGAPRSASVLATRDTRFFEIPRTAFERLSAMSPELALSFARLLTERITRANTDLSSAAETEQAFLLLLAEQNAAGRRGLIGDSPSLQRLRARAAEAASASLVVITGPAGTEKDALAWEVHRAGSSPDGPFLTLDAQAVTLSGETPGNELELELAQACALLGSRPGALLFSGVTRVGLLKAANGGTLVIQNADSLAPALEIQLAEFVRTGRYKQLGGEHDCESRVRLILTTEGVRRDSDLTAMAKETTLVLPPLKSRKQDLLPLIEHLAREHTRKRGKDLQGIDPEAHSRLLAYDWPGNTAELEVVIRRAAALAQGEYLTAEDIFLTANPSSSGAVVNLFSIAEPRRNELWGVRFGATAIGAVVFIFLLWQGTLGVRAAYDRAALALTWVFWEPTIILGSLLAARAWCAVCPIGATAGLLSRFGFQRRAPGWLRDRGVWISAIGIAAILWAQAAWRMEASVRATAGLIWAILVPALLAGLLFKRRTWCRYLCPLGQMIGAFSTCSATELRGNPGVCGTQCKDHRCYAGADGRDGCPVFEGPFALRSNTQCVVCFDCVRACENASPAWNLRLPGAELWTAARPFAELAVLVPAIMGAQFFRALAHAGLPSGWNTPLPLALLCAACVAGSYAFTRRVATATFPPEDRGFLAHALVILAAAWEFSYQGGNLLSLAGTGWAPVMTPWAIKVCQYGLSAAGLGACLTVLHKLALRRAARTPAFVRYSLIAIGIALPVLQLFDSLHS